MEGYGVVINMQDKLFLLFVKDEEDDIEKIQGYKTIENAIELFNPSIEAIFSTDETESKIHTNFIKSSKPNIISIKDNPDSLKKYCNNGDIDIIVLGAILNDRVFSSLGCEVTKDILELSVLDISEKILGKTTELTT